MRQFCACKRQYYYHRYLKWGGWSANASEESREAYRLSKMKSLSILAGELVHKGIEEVLLRYRHNRILISEAETIASARLRWNKALPTPNPTLERRAQAVHLPAGGLLRPPREGGSRAPEVGLRRDLTDQFLRLTHMGASAAIQSRSLAGDGWRSV